jgi:Ca-activated chloride channel family protein
MMFFLVLAVFAAAEPRNGRKPVASESSGLDVAVAFDVSRSMLAEDLEPNRLQRSVTVLQQLSRGVRDSRFSLIPFKGDASLLVPMTEDRVVLDLWIPRLGPGLSTVPGTDIEKALRAAWASFPQGEGRSRVLVLITDGDSLSGRIDRIARELAEAGIPVYIMAAGTAEGAAIPLGDGSYVKDSTGRTVVSRTDIEALRRLARATGGSFHQLSQPGSISDLAESIEELRGFSESRGIHFTGVNRYRSFLFPALLLLFFNLIVRIVPWRRS